jgi:hypothetical protein
VFIAIESVVFAGAEVIGVAERWDRSVIQWTMLVTLMAFLALLIIGLATRA